MRTKFGSFIVDGQGKIGGHVVSTDRGGKVLRWKPTVTFKNSSYQQQIALRFTSSAVIWKTLSNAQRQTWIDGSKNFPYTDYFGDSKRLSGFSLFQKINNNLASVQIAPIFTCPSPSKISSVDLLSVFADAENQRLFISFDANIPATVKLRIYGSPCLSPGITNSDGKLISFSSVSSGVASPIDISAPYINRNGVIQSGRAIFFKVHFINTTTGLASPFQSTSIIVP